MSASFVQKATKTKRKEKIRNTLKFQTMIQKCSQKEKRDEVYVAPDDGPCLTLARAKS